MGFTKKTWKNRIAEYINRRRLTMEDGSTNLVTVARDEGTISQEGDAFNAANMNDLEDRIEEGFDEINQSLTQQSSIVVNKKYGKNISALVAKCNDRYIVSGMIQLTTEASGQDILSIIDNGEVVILKNRCDVLFADIVNNKTYAAYGAPGFTGIASNTNAIPSGLYIIHGIIQ